MPIQGAIEGMGSSPDLHNLMLRIQINIKRRAGDIIIGASYGPLRGEGGRKGEVHGMGHEHHD